jgi:hypothetical protein
MMTKVNLYPFVGVIMAVDPLHHPRVLRIDRELARTAGRPPNDAG